MINSTFLARASVTNNPQCPWYIGTKFGITRTQGCTFQIGSWRNNIALDFGAGFPHPGEVAQIYHKNATFHVAYEGNKGGTTDTLTVLQCANPASAATLELYLDNCQFTIAQDAVANIGTFQLFEVPANATLKVYLINTKLPDYAIGTITGTLEVKQLRDEPAAKTANYTATLGDVGLSIPFDTSGAGRDYNLLPAAYCEGMEFIAHKTGNDVNSLTLTPDGAETINGTASTTSAYGVVAAKSDGTEWFITRNI